MAVIHIDQLYSSGQFSRILADFKHSAPLVRFGEPLIVFGTHRDENFTAEDVTFILQSLSSAESITAEGILGGIGNLKRGWFSSTFNRFILLFIAELRTLICKSTNTSRTTAKASQVTADGVATGMAAWIATKFGVSDPVALGIATAVLLSILYATKGAFCKMTDVEVEKSLKQRLPRMK